VSQAEPLFFLICFCLSPSRRYVSTLAFSHCSKSRLSRVYVLVRELSPSFYQPPQRQLASFEPTSPGSRPSLPPFFSNDAVFKKNLSDPSFPYVYLFFPPTTELAPPCIDLFFFSPQRGVFNFPSHYVHIFPPPPVFSSCMSSKKQQADPPRTNCCLLFKSMMTHFFPH